MSQGSNSALKAQLKTLIAAKQYEAAILLLKASDLPDKITFINRIQKRMKEEREAENAKVAAKPEPVKATPLPDVKAPVKSKQVSGSDRIIRLLVFGIVMVPVVFLAGHALNSYINRYQWRMEDICQTVYRDDWLDGTFTFGQWYYGCQSAATHAIDLYGDEIRYCYDSSNQTDKNFMQCLVDQDVALNRGYLYEVAK